MKYTKKQTNKRAPARRPQASRAPADDKNFSSITTLRLPLNRAPPVMAVLWVILSIVILTK